MGQQQSLPVRDEPLWKLTFTPGNVTDLLLASLLLNVLSLALPLTLLQIYDRILPNSAERTLVMLLLGVGGALIFETLLRLSRSYVSGWMGARFEHLAGAKALGHLLESDIVQFEKVGPGVQMERMNALKTLREFYSGQALLALVDLPFAVLFLMIIWYLAGNLVLVPIVLITCFLLAALYAGKLLHKDLKSLMMADDRRLNFIIEVLGGIHTVKSMTMEKQMERRYERLQESCAEANHQVVLRSGFSAGLGGLFSQLSLFLVVGAGAMAVIEGTLTVGGLAACTMLSGRAMQPLQRAVGLWTRFQTTRLAKDRVHDLFQTPIDPLGERPDMPPIKGALALKVERFNFGKNRDGDELPDLFTHLDLTIREGETIGIVGDSTSGKTTLLNLMMGLVRPTEGKVFFDGKNIADYDPASVRRQAAYLPQDAVMFNGTILENITQFQRDKRDRALEIAISLGLDRVVSHLPLGYETPIGNRTGESLPRGIQQRIAVARALLNDAPIVLFDEANSAMDPDGESQLQKILEEMNGQRTLILVTKRPSLLRLADRIFKLENGGLFPDEEKASIPAPPAASRKPGKEAP